MNTIGMGVDYSNICKDYNTMYLDRDNTDRETQSCMKKVVHWMNTLLTDFINEFKLNIYNMDSDAKVEVDTVAANRFLFYSLEKEITLQSFILENELTNYKDIEEWSKKNENSLLIKNDDEGEGVYFYMRENTDIHLWFKERLKEFSIDNLTLNIK